METQILDAILALQLQIARTGESEQMNWWDMDATDIDGGGDFFQRLMGDLGALAGAEAALAGAKAKELRLLAERNASEQNETLFNPELDLALQLEQRWKYFKAHPEAVPEQLKSLIDPKQSYDISALESLVADFDRPSYERSAVGRKLRGQREENPLQRMQALAAVLFPLESDRQQYPLPYRPVA